MIINTKIRAVVIPALAIALLASCSGTGGDAAVTTVTETTAAITTAETTAATTSALYADYDCGAECAGAPAKALEFIYGKLYEPALSETDAGRKLEDYRWLSAEVVGTPLLGECAVWKVYYKLAIKPESAESYLATTLPTITPVWGEGELKDYIVLDGTATIHEADGLWSILGLFTPGLDTCREPGLGISPSCGEPLFEGELTEELKALPQAGNETTYLSDTDKLDWAALTAEKGAEHARFWFEGIKANAIAPEDAEQTRNDVFGGLLSAQKLRTACVLWSVNNVMPELAEDYAKLLSQLIQLNSEEFDSCLNQLPAERRAQIIALMT